jgi:3-methyladenine DNA glycosylase AlkD
MIPMEYLKPLGICLVEARPVTMTPERDRMPNRQPKRNPSASASAHPPPRAVDGDVTTALTWLKRHGSAAGRAGMARYAIPSDKAFGVAMRDIQVLARRLGRDHDLAAALWATGWYEARTLAAYVGEPARLTPAQMDRWCGDFDTWAICDTLCFVLFDKTPHAWAMVKRWSHRRDEFGKRAAFALLWGLSVHDKRADDRAFLEGLDLIERAATDERHFVKKAVNMALRAVGKRNPELNAAALAVAARLAVSPDSTARWVGKDALRELSGPSVRRRLARVRRNAE